jgi:hypothetical protein
MISQYPHIISISLPNATPPVLKSGEWVFGTEQGAVSYPCRCEPNSKGNTIPTASGDLVAYSYTVYLPTLNIDIPFNTKCTLTIGTLIINTTIKWSMNYQLHSEIRV